MPFKSQAQERFFFANKGKLEKQGVNVNEWAQASKGMNLPQRIGPPSGPYGKPSSKGVPR